MAKTFQRRIIVNNEKQRDTLLAAVRTMGHMSLLSFSLAKNEMLNAYLMLRDQPDIFRQRVKMLANRSMKKAEIHMATVNKAFENGTGYWLTYSDTVIDSAESDVTRFRIALKQELDKNGEPQSMLISQIETARVLLDMSVLLHDQIVKEARNQCGRDYTSTLSFLRCTSELESWNRLCEAVKGGREADLNTPQAEACYNAMLDKFLERRYAVLSDEAATTAVS